MATTSARALAVLAQLAGEAVVGAPLLAAQLGVTERTVRRDVDTLRALGYDIEAVPGVGGGYRMRGGRLPPLQFDEEQVVAIAVALQTAPAVLTGIAESSARALATVRQVMPERLRVEAGALPISSIRNYWEFPAPPIDADVVRAVGAAVRRRHVLRAVYDLDRVRVEAHELVVWAGRWYLVGFDLDADRWRVLRLDRLEVKDPTHVPFADREPPGGSATAFVTRSVDRGDRLAAWPCTGSAVIAVAPEAAAEFAPGGAVVERVDDGHARLHLGAWSWTGLAGLLLTFAADLTEVQPPALREALDGIAARIARMPT